WAGFLAAFVALHFVDRGALRGTGARVSIPKVALFALLHGAAILLTSLLVPTAAAPASLAAIVGIWTTVALAHRAANRQRPTLSYISPVYRPLVRALLQPGDVAARRRAIVELVASSDLKLELDSLAQNRVTGRLAGDLSELLSQEFEKALDRGANAKWLRSVSDRTAASLRELLTGETAENNNLFGGSLGALHEDAVRSAAEEKRPVLSYEFISETDPVLAAQRAAYSASRLFHRDAAVGLVLVVESDAVRQAVVAALPPTNGAVEVVVRGDRTFSQIRDAALANPGVAAMAERAENRLLIPAGFSLPAGFFDLTETEMARYRVFVLILETLNAIAVEIRSTDLNDLGHIQTLVQSQA
ncbi:MAG: hypothetical protein JO102_06495, partial [Elusimicrobia bacterium]|nr:hypothetical protein [Elusimicrobiota bacterium]